MREIEKNKLREEIKQLKKEKAISYSYLAKQIGIKASSFYNFLFGSKELAEKRKELLKKQIRRFM